MSFSIFKSANLSQFFSSLLLPVQAMPPHICSFFSLVRITLEIPHSSGHADHSPHSSQVQSTGQHFLLHSERLSFSASKHALPPFLWFHFTSLDLNFMPSSPHVLEHDPQCPQ